MMLVLLLRGMFILWEKITGLPEDNRRKLERPRKEVEDIGTDSLQSSSKENFEFAESDL